MSGVNFDLTALQDRTDYEKHDGEYTFYHPEADMIEMDSQIAQRMSKFTYKGTSNSSY